MHDIGLVKLFAGGRGLLTVSAGMFVGYLLAGLVGLPAAVGLTLGALPAFLSSFAIVDDRASRVAARSALLVVPFALALYGSIALREYRILELALMVALLFVQFYAPRFGIWAGDFAVGLFAAYLCGLLLPLPIAAFDGLALILAGGLAAAILVRFLVFHPNNYRSLSRVRRAFLAWENRVVDAAATALENDGARAGSRDLRRLRRTRSKAHGVALVADAMLARPGAGDTGDAAENLHRILFDTELAVDGLARLTEQLIRSGSSRQLRDRVAEPLRLAQQRGGRSGEHSSTELLDWLESAEGLRVAADPGQRKVVRRIALLLRELATSAREWGSIRDSLPQSGDGVPFESPLVLAMGRVAGAMPVANEVLATGGMSGPWRRITLSPALRTGIQAAIAVALTEPLAYLTGGSRFYWAVIGVMIILTGTNTTHERLRKLGNRALGTIIGGVLGIALVTLLGTDHIWLSLILIVVALAVGMYGFSQSYMIWVIALVVVLCQVYEFSGTLTDDLVVVRLFENVLGAGIAVLVSMFVFPIATGAVIRRAVLRQLVTVRRFVERAGVIEGADADDLRLRSDSRAIDSATHQLDAVLKPVFRFSTGGGYRRDDETRTILYAVAGHARRIAFRAESRTPIPPAASEQLVSICAAISVSITALEAGVTGTADQGWTRSGSAIDDLERAADDVPGQAWLRYRVHELGRIDDALASLAELHGLKVGSVDEQRP
jgi:uncharacterized membrane protein YgaE (UPF0421/DUF939 family)